MPFNTALPASVSIVLAVLSWAVLSRATGFPDIVTADMGTRKNLMIENSDAFLTLPGGLGTLDELFEVWTTATLDLHHKPIVLLDPDGFIVSWNLGAQRTLVLVDGRREKIRSGMRVSAEIKTGDRRVIEYLLSPVMQAVKEAGRER